MTKVDGIEFYGPLGAFEVGQIVATPAGLGCQREWRITHADMVKVEGGIACRYRGVEVWTIQHARALERLELSAELHVRQRRQQFAAACFGARP